MVYTKTTMFKDATDTAKSIKDGSRLVLEDLADYMSFNRLRSK